MNWSLKKQRNSTDSGLFASRPRFHWGWVTVVMLTLGLTLSFVAFFATRARENVKDTVELERDTRRLALHVAGEFVLPIESLRATAAYFASSEEVTRTEFRAFTHTVLEDLPQIYCFEWMPLIESSERDSFELALRESGFPSFQIMDKDSLERNLVAAPERERYLPILYMEPLDASILGLDTGAVESARSSTGRRAWEEERITVSRPYRLLEDAEGVFSLTCYAPVFNVSGFTYEQVGTGRGKFIGLVAVIMRIEATVRRAQTNSQAEHLDLAIVDVTDPEKPATIFASNVAMQEAALSSRHLIDRPADRPRRDAVLWSPAFPFGDRQWHVAARSVPGGELAESGPTPIYVLLVGLALAAALTWGAGSLQAVARLRRQVDAALELGQYRLGNKLGEGGMGMVFEAEHRMLARRAAIKLIRPEKLGAAGTSAADHILERFENEAKATAQLSSPHTISIFDFGRTDRGDFYYVMEFLDGFDLETLVKKHGPADSERVVHFLIQACHSLAEAHSAGLIHRDIKPANLYLCRSGLDVDVVKVLDFGLVKRHRAGVTASRDDTGLTQENAVVGTPAYLSPEAALGSEELDGRSDLYALGCVAYWLLTGTPVFTGNTPMEVILQHVRETPPPLSSVAEVSVPAPLEAVVMRCLAKNREERPADARELANLLTGVGLVWDEEKARRWWKTHYPVGE